MVDNKNNAIRHIKKRAFISAFARCGYVNQAAKVANIHRDTHYAWLVSDPEYAEAFEGAKQEYIGLLEAECDRRAVTGVDEPLVHQGQFTKDENGKVLTRKKYSDILLMFRIKKLDPSYRDGQQINITQNQAQQVNVSLDEKRSRVKAMILKSQEVQGELPE